MGLASRGRSNHVADGRTSHINHLSLPDVSQGKGCGSPLPVMMESADSPRLVPYIEGEVTTPDLLSSNSYALSPASPIASMPGEIRFTPAVTPPADELCQLDMNLVVGGVLAPVTTSPIQRAYHKRDASLRLPSFEELGIASPHPDRLSPCNTADDKRSDSLTDTTQNTLPQGSLSAMSPLDALGSLHLTGSTLRERPTNKPLPHVGDLPLKAFVNTLTPPAEGEDFQWAAPGMAPAMPSPADDLEAERLNGPMLTEAQSHSGSSAGESRSWLERVISLLLTNISHQASSINILSHALPSPSIQGHVFSSIVTALHQNTPTANTVWVNVFHAIPGRFNIADVPTSPPATPAPAGTGEDYFTSRTFDSAVSITDYQQDLSKGARSPCPIVRPSSIDISIVERYIPPTNTNEFSGLSDPSGPSILVDRLVELSPQNGRMIFIYPTRTGARTFMREYLSPVLDRALRSMAVVHNLPSEFGRLVGRMAAVEELLEHSAMEGQIRALCDRLTQLDSSTQRFYDRQTRFSLIHSSTAVVTLSRETWARDWWTKQEKPRIRKIVSRFADDPLRRVSDASATPIVLLQQLLDDVVKKEYPPGQTGLHGIEVSVFVLQKSKLLS